MGELPRQQPTPLTTSGAGGSGVASTASADVAVDYRPVVLVHAAGSGVGTAAVQLATHAGARVLAVAGEQWVVWILVRMFLIGWRRHLQWGSPRALCWFFPLRVVPSVVFIFSTLSLRGSI